MNKPLLWWYETDCCGSQYRVYKDTRYFIHKPSGFTFYYTWSPKSKVVNLNYGTGWSRLEPTTWQLTDLLNPAFEFEEVNRETIRRKFPRGLL